MRRILAKFRCRMGEDQQLLQFTSNFLSSNFLCSQTESTPVPAPCFANVNRWATIRKQSKGKETWLTLGTYVLEENQERQDYQIE